MLRFISIAFLLIGAIVPACAQEPCGFGSENAFDNLAKALSEAKSCQAAVAKMHECAWGSSADTQLAPIVITKCERTFLDKLSAVAQKSYADEMQLCAYEYAGQEGTMYMSAAALCQVDVAAHYAADPVAASKLAARASFDCARARTPLEKAICSDISLGHADIVLSRVYSGLLNSSDEKDKTALVQSERQWLQSVPAKCGPLAPPFSTKSLNCARNEFESRFTALDSCQESITKCLREADAEASAAPSVAAPRASFDCEAPSSALEIVICADAELGQIDIKLAQSYRDASTIMVGGQRRDLTGSERQWLRFVSKSCPLGAVGGIPSVIARSCVRDAFQVRIEQLQTCSQKEPQKQTPCLNDFHLSEKK
jgi:uncharacterized protein